MRYGLQQLEGQAVCGVHFAHRADTVNAKTIRGVGSQKAAQNHALRGRGQNPSR